MLLEKNSVILNGEMIFKNFRMEYIKPVSGTVGQILCCQCGVPIEPNPTNTCVTCLRREVDITQGIPRQSVINWCKERVQNA